MGQDSQLQVFTAELASEQIAKEAIEKLKQIYWQKTCSNDL